MKRNNLPDLRSPQRRAFLFQMHPERASPFVLQVFTDTALKLRLFTIPCAALPRHGRPDPSPLSRADRNGRKQEYPTVATELRSALSKQIERIREGLKTYPLVKARRASDQ